MKKCNEILVLFVIISLLAGPIFVDATWDVFKVVGEPKCINGNNIEVYLTHTPISLPSQGKDANVDTKNINIFPMINSAVGVDYPNFEGGWSKDSWGPNEEITLNLNPGLWSTKATNFGMEWLNPATPGDGLSGSFINPCYVENGGNPNKNPKVPIMICENGKWVVSAEQGYCDYSGDTIYVDPMGIKHCIGISSSNYIIIQEGSWCQGCGNGVCDSSEDCSNCLQDCGCKQNEACSYNDYTSDYNCKQIIDIKEFDRPKEVDLFILQNRIPGVIIADNKKNYTLSFFRPVSTEGGYAEEVSVINPLSDNKYGSIIKIGENISIKLGENELNIKLISMDGNAIKFLFSKPSKFNFNKQYLYYGIIPIFVVIILFLGFFYLFKDISLNRKKNIGGEFSNMESKEILEEETKEKISSNITEAITITGLGVKRGSNTILENISFSVKRGEFVSLLGPSGSGKSTIIEILAGRKKPSSGKIKIFEKSFDEQGINKHVGFVPQSNEIYLNQTVLKNLENSVIKWGIKNSEQKISDVLDQVNLTERKNLIASKLSGGQQKLLSLAMELIREPELLILDEPTTGLDPNTRNQIITLLCNLSRDNKKTVLITTHFMDDSEESDEVVIINNKKIVAKGSPEKLKKMLPGYGKMVTLVLDNSDKDLLEKIRKTKGIERVIAEGRTLNILTNNPNAVEIANKVHEYGGYVNESKISKASMKEVFVFFTGRSPEE